MNQNQDLTKSLKTIIDNNFFVYKGTTIEKLVGGYRVLSQKVTTMEQVDEVINRGYGIIEKSIK